MTGGVRINRGAFTLTTDTATVAPVLPPVIDIAGLEPLPSGRRRWPAIFGTLLTIAMIVGLGRQLLGAGLAGLGRSVPADPRFYLYFALLYMSLPIGDFAIFRRLWGIPLGGGLAALIKKRIANEVVLGYSGEAYFYAWARARATMVAAPFGAVKTCRSCPPSRAMPRPC